ncbi:NYN domain-containing protein [Aquabacterium sp.]|uniref:NYN domain-containing protein n=1 Tax=Aquabacterium sp. TaxID=1872578 RepID=UPI0025C2465C|nr:NYN domain-containing protein [Aquabacterium sp.]
MAQDNISMALFCDFENVALGVRDANYDKFDIKRVLERLLVKGSIVVKKAYCDWERYKGFKAPMHEANFELIEIPHVRQSGKNSADIRLVVDALDLCYTKSHVNTFVIISGDSDFSPLVSKLRENAKHVIGVGVKQSTSDLLIANCDEFIFYDDLVRESQRQAARRNGGQTPAGRDAAPQPRRSPEEEKRRREEMDARRLKAVEMAAETYEALVTDRDDGGRIWASVLKEAIKRRNPGFSESYYGFRTFGNLLEEAQGRGLLDFGRDEKSGTWVARGTGVPSTGALVRGDGGTAMADLGHKDDDLRPSLRDEPEDEADVSGAVFTSVTVMPAAGVAPVDAEALAAEQAPDEGGARRRSRGGRGRTRTGREAGRDSGREGGRDGARDTAAREAGHGDNRQAGRQRPGPSGFDERAATEPVRVAEPAPAAALAPASKPAAVEAPSAPARKRAPRKTANAAPADKPNVVTPAGTPAAAKDAKPAAKKAPARPRAKHKAAAKKAD